MFCVFVVFFFFLFLTNKLYRNRASRSVPCCLKLDEMTMQKNGSNKKHHTFLLLSSVEKKLWILEFYCGFYWFSGVL